MKPRLRLKGGVWSCSSWNPWPFGKVCSMGYGYTPREAYGDWILERLRDALA